MSTAEHPMLDKIRALLAKAESTHHPEEARLFAEKAQELMTKYAIDEAMVAHGQGHQDYASIDQTSIWMDANEYRAPKVSLLQWIAQTNDCKIVLYRQQYVNEDKTRICSVKMPGLKRMFRIAIIGYAGDRSFVERLYTSLLLQCEQQLISDETMARMELECDQSGHRIAWRNAFVNGYASAIGYRLGQARDRAKAESATQYGNGMAMVLADRLALVDKRMAEMFGKMRKTPASSASRHVGSASGLGHEAGHRADLGGGKVSSQGERRMLS